MGIPEKLFERTDRLSGGQHQRVAIARALFQEPVALLADEPVSSVDPARARDTVELLTRISREEHLTLVMSIHDLELARAHFGGWWACGPGRVVFDRPTRGRGDGRRSSALRARRRTRCSAVAPDARPLAPAVARRRRAG